MVHNANVFRTHWNVSDFETGIIAVASMISAFIIYRQARYMRDQTEILKDQSQKTIQIIEIEQKRDLQAYKISGWLTVSTDHGDTGSAVARGRTPSAAQIFNGSNQPIYDVTGKIWNTAIVYSNGTCREIQTFDLGTVPPATQIRVNISDDYVQEQKSAYIGIYGPRLSEFSGWFMKPLEISFKFRDSEDIWWERDLNCRMRKLED